jgi:small subunit ribosomal protein S16
MSVRIRLSRHGKKKAPFYRLVVTDSRSPRDGRFIEILGTYNPLTDPAEINLDAERAEHWINHGALPSQTARALLRKAGVFGDQPAEAQPAAEAEAPAEVETEAAPAAPEAEVKEEQETKEVQE